MAWSALGEGPYGFSFELNRTTAEEAASVTIGSSAKVKAGLTMAHAAPAPNSCANLRREMENVFIVFLRNFLDAIVILICSRIPDRSVAGSRHPLGLPLQRSNDELTLPGLCVLRFPHGVRVIASLWAVDKPGSNVAEDKSVVILSGLVARQRRIRAARRTKVVLANIGDSGGQAEEESLNG